MNPGCFASPTTSADPMKSLCEFGLPTTSGPGRDDAPSTMAALWTRAPSSPALIASAKEAVDPPSLIGAVPAVPGPEIRDPEAMACVAARAVRVPLNLSGYDRFEWHRRLAGRVLVEFWRDLR